MNLFSSTLLSKTTFALAALVALGAVPASAHTAPFSFFGTGVDAGGTPLAHGTFGDPHTSLTMNLVGASSQIQMLTSAYGFPVVQNDDPFVGPKTRGLYDWNGVDTGSTWGDYGSYGTFAIGSGFQSGLNTVGFRVADDGAGATGLRVDGVSGSASPVPEASTTVSFGLLLALALGGAVIARRKRAVAA